MNQGTTRKAGKRRAGDAFPDLPSAARIPHEDDDSIDDDESHREDDRGERSSSKAGAPASLEKDLEDSEDDDNRPEEYATREGGTQRKRRKTAKFKKHPDAPKRFRSAFIIFSQQRHKELRAKLNAEGGEIDTMNIAGQISEEWRTLEQDAKKKWEEMAREDKERYQREKATYSGPWKVRTNLRKPKDPNSPKKPVPAYFAFSNERRQEVKNQNQNATNGEISRILSKMWKEASEEVRKMYLDSEAREREKYSEKMVEWKEKRKREAAENAERADESMCNKQHDFVGQSQGQSAAPIGMDQISLMGGGNTLTGMLASQSQGSNFQVGDIRLNQPSSSASRVQHPQSSYMVPPEGAFRMLQETSSMLPQGVLGASLLQQAPQNTASLNQDLLTRLLSTIQAPHMPTQNTNDGNLLQQVVLAALQQQQQPAVRNFGNQAFGNGTLGQWMGGGTWGNNNAFGQSSGENAGSAAPAWSSSIQQSNADSSGSFDLMSLLSRQSNMGSTSSGANAGDFTRSMQQLGGNDCHNAAPLTSFGGTGTNPDNNLLLRLLGQQQQQQQYQQNGFEQPTVSVTSGTINSNSTSSSSNVSHDPFIQNLLRQLASGGGMPPSG